MNVTGNFAITRGWSDAQETCTRHFARFPTILWVFDLAGVGWARFRRLIYALAATFRQVTRDVVQQSRAQLWGLADEVPLEHHDTSAASAFLDESLQSVEASVQGALTILHQTLKPHTVALLWFDEHASGFVVAQSISPAQHLLRRTAIAPGEGLVGLIAKCEQPVLLPEMHASHAGLAYYARPPQVGAFAGVPIRSGDRLHGILLVDRLRSSPPFEPSVIPILSALAHTIARAVRVEQMVATLRRDTMQKDGFYQASRAFNAVLTLDDVAQVAVQAAQQITGAELAAVVVLEAGTQLRIVAASWQGHRTAARELVGQRFDLDEGLVGAAIKMRTILPHGMQRMADLTLLSDRIDVPLPAVKALPLVWKDQGIGALVLGASHSDALRADHLEMLHVVADHAAAAIVNAQMYARMEQLATTDGLTGLVNNRQFHVLFEAAVERTERYQRKVSLILADIDHFKRINDTYGHPVGDVVLQRVAEVLRSNARRCDVVARYGGEEFAILMEDTDERGACKIAERMRKAVETEIFCGPVETFHVTLSLGIATFPDNGTEKGRLTECADQALYSAKRSGRNTSITYTAIRGSAALGSVDHSSSNLSTQASTSSDLVQ